MKICNHRHVYLESPEVPILSIHEYPLKKTPRIASSINLTLVICCMKIADLGLHFELDVGIELISRLGILPLAS